MWMQQKHISLFLGVSVVKAGANTHKHEFQGIQWFFFTFSLFTRACYITDTHWQSETDCVGRGWKFGEYYNFALCVCLGVCENTLYAVHCVQPHVVLQVLPLHASHSICFPEKYTPSDLYKNPKCCATTHIESFSTQWYIKLFVNQFLFVNYVSLCSC